MGSSGRAAPRWPTSAPVCRYALKLVLGNAPYALTWCRYSFFLILYPMGVTGEIYTNLAAVEASHAADFSNGMAGSLAAMYRALVWAFILLYIPGFPPLYLCGGGSV